MTGEPVAVTGHQPPALGGYGPEVSAALLRVARGWVAARRPSEVVSGMAAGWDLAMAEAALLEGVPLVAALAFEEQGAEWPDGAAAHLRGLLARAGHVHLMAKERAPGMWTARDRWVLERGSRVVALWSGAEGGTARAVATALKLGKPVENLWDLWLAEAPPATD